MRIKPYEPARFFAGLTFINTCFKKPFRRICKFVHEVVVFTLPLGYYFRAMSTRALQRNVEASLADRPVVLLIGARQSGKSTLASHLANSGHIDRSVSFDDLGPLSAARADPVGFIEGLQGRVFIDEIQRVPELLLPIKVAVDRNRTPGRFLLSGSANVLTLPRVADSLVGRMDVLRLFPFSQGEIAGEADGFIDTVFSTDLLSLDTHFSEADILARIVRGGFPEIITTIAPHRWSNWWDSYILTIVQRDLRELSNIVDLDHIPRLLSLLAARTATLLNHAEISRSTGIPATTLRRYMAMLKAAFLISETLPWHANLGKRIVKAAKVHIMDTGLAVHLLGLNRENLDTWRDRIGPLLETFVTHELEKQISWSRVKPGLFHYRTHGGEEVALVLEDRGGRIVGIEIKASATVSNDMFKNLRNFSALTKSKFIRGIVLYNGREIIPFGPNLHAVPLAALWTWGGRALTSKIPV